MGSLEEDMRRMLSDDRFSDMVFVCGYEGEEVPALRMLVAARSPTLQSMLLTSGLAETKLSRVSLPEMDPSTMRICMEFFYTGTFQDSSCTGLFSTMKVISAGRFFLNPKLEELAISRLSLYKVLHDGVDIARAYTYAVELQLDHPNVNSLMQKLSNWIVHDAHLSLKCYKHLSDQAFIHLVQNLDKSLFTLQEYCIFHIIVQWCSSQLLFTSGDPSITKETVTNAIEKTLPWTLDNVRKHLAMTTDDLKHSLTPSMLKVMKLLEDPISSCLTKVNLDLSKIPAQVLSTIIEPLELVPESMLFSAYKQQALSIPMNGVLRG